MGKEGGSFLGRGSLATLAMSTSMLLLDHYHLVLWMLILLSWKIL